MDKNLLELAAQLGIDIDKDISEIYDQTKDSSLKEELISITLSADAVGALESMGANVEEFIDIPSLEESILQACNRYWEAEGLDLPDDSEPDLDYQDKLQEWAD